MRIALIGYGKMGKMIEELAISQGHEVVLRISADNKEDFNKENLVLADVAIEFTGPDAAFDNVMKCLEWNIPVVSGSTGWNSRLKEAEDFCRSHNGSFLHASNFSIGVNIFFQVNRFLARMMNEQKTYDVTIKEIHHTEKKDAPSGTAVTLAEQVLENLERKNQWVKEEGKENSDLIIYSERTDPAPGTHYVKYSSEIDDIEIIHTAHNRRGFAAGAIKAAEFIYTRKGVFTMQQVLGL